MKCQWESVLNILPLWVRDPVDRWGRDTAQEVRLRIGQSPVVQGSENRIISDRLIRKEDLMFCLNTATRYSPWISESITEGFVTSRGGHRIGICGDCVYENGALKNISTITSLCIRVARDFPGVSKEIYQTSRSVLVIGSPNSGKTTFLRDLIRKKSLRENVVVVDERRELFPINGTGFCFDSGRNTDVLSGCGKVHGIEMVLRSMGPTVIAVDEITAEEDCYALASVARCGVRVIASAHAGNQSELKTRKIYRPILETGIFDTLIVMQRDKSWKKEEIEW